MRIRYNESTDTAYVYLREASPEEPRPKVDEAEEVAPGVIVDFDEEDRPVGIEIYDGAREKLAGAPLDAEAVERIRQEERERVLDELARRIQDRRARDMVVAAIERLRAGYSRTQG